MKYRVVYATDNGPTFSEWPSLEEIASLLLMWGRSGMELKTDSVWKQVRGKWVPAWDGQFRGREV